MADKETDDEGPSLELPSFGFRRKRRRAGTPDPEPTHPAPAPDALEDASVDDEHQPPPEPEPTRDAPVPEPDPAAEPAQVAEPAPAVTGPRPDSAPQSPPRSRIAPEPFAEEAPSARRGPLLPQISGLPAAVVTGVLIGALLVGATWSSLRLCELVRGTSSCGDPGIFLLLAVLVVMVVLGRWLLTSFGVGEAGSTSFLGVGLIAVIALLFLVELLFEWWMVIAIPVVGAVAFGLSHWVTTNFVDADPGDDMHR